MEIFRRLGVAGAVRDAGLPPDYPNDVAYRTSFLGQELSRIRIPCRLDRYTPSDGPDMSGRRRSRRIASTRFIWSPSCSSMPRSARMRIINRVSVLESRSAMASQVTACATSTAGRLPAGLPLPDRLRRRAVRVVRKAIGAELAGDAIIQRVQSTYIRAPGLCCGSSRRQHADAWGTGAINPRRTGNGAMRSTGARPGWSTPTWARRNRFRGDRPRRRHPRPSWASDPISATRSSAARTGSGGGCWPNKFREGWVFLCGDAAHLSGPVSRATA